jgi:hypothetical protein
MSCNNAKNILGGLQKCYANSHSVAENGKRFELLKDRNRAISICKIKIDGCLITGASARCDYLFYVDPPGSFHFVELKGGDISHAFDQIKSTVIFIKGKGMNDKKRIFGHIVSSGVPRAANEKFKKLKEIFKRDLGQVLTRETNTMKHRI